MGEPWFGAKTYGIGLSPKGAAGWISVAVFCALATLAPLAGLALNWPAWTILASLGLLTIAFLVLIVLKSDRQPWRWRGR